MANLALIRTFLYRHEAETAKGLLKERNIEAIILADDAGGYIPNASLGTGNVKLMVQEHDVSMATEALQVLDTDVDNTLWEEDATSVESNPAGQLKKESEFKAWPLAVIGILGLIVALIYFFNKQ